MKKVIDNYSSWVPNKYTRLILFMLPFIIYFMHTFTLDNDFWFLINTGEEIINNGFITIEPFTIHEGLSFIPQQWLTDILFYKIYSSFGIYGMLFLMIILNIIIEILIYKICKLVSNKEKIPILVTVIVDFLIVYMFLTTRPQVFDIIFFLLELLLLEKYIKNGKKSFLYYLPLISLLLINIHASMWIMFFVFLLPYYAEYIINKLLKKDTIDIKPILIITFLCILVGFINPYGFNSILYLFNSFGNKYINYIVYEMQCTLKPDFILIYVYILIMIITFIKKRKDIKLRYLFLFLGTMLLSIMHYRGIMLLLIVSPIIFSYNLSNIFKDDYEAPLSINNKIINILGIAIIILILVPTIDCTTYYDVSPIADYLDKYADKDIILYTNYNKGDYLEYRGYKCYIDARAEVFLKSNNKKEDIFVEYYNLVNGYIPVNEFLLKYDFDYVLTNEESFLYKNMPYNYKVVYETHDSFTYYLLKKIE